LVGSDEFKIVIYATTPNGRIAACV